MSRPDSFSRGLLSAALSLLLLGLSSCVGRPSSGEAGHSTRPADRPVVILISLDGFRWDYLDLYDAPTLERLAREGVQAESLIPVFPSKTFPSHYSAVTGLYPGSHGIVSNTIYDPDTGARFSISNREAVMDASWWGGEPIWVTAEKQGLTSATYFWPGSEAAVSGIRPTYWKEYDVTVPGEDRVDQVLDWLDLPDSERPSIITLYFSDVDGAGHRHGPNSPEVAAAVERVDDHVKRLVDGLDERRLLNDAHLLVISDHGMADTSPDRVVLIDEYIETEGAHVIDYSPVLMMYPPEGRAEEVYEGLRDAPHLDVYWKDELPERFHLDHPRTPPLLAIAEDGWVLSTRSYFERDPGRYAGGAHGYDNRAPSMGGIFIARGPRFRAGRRVPPVEIINLYELMCALLELEPAPNEGDPAVLSALLEDRVAVE